MTDLAGRFGPRLRADPRRVITRLFVPGEELPDSSSRGHTVIDRVLSLDDAEVVTCLDDVRTRFAGRHRDLDEVLHARFLIAARGRPDLDRIGAQRQLLIGSYFSMEYAVEAAALFNPSMVAHPDQGGLGADQVRFVMSVRAVGEGHISSVEFRTGVIGPGPTMTVDDPGRYLVAGAARPATFRLEVFRALLADLHADPETVEQVLRDLPARFDVDRLQQVVAQQQTQLRGRQAGQQAIDKINQLVADKYEVSFPSETTISERLLWPSSPAESQGMEDVRLVAFTDGDGRMTYRGTYTAYDGSHIAPKLLTTSDFETFQVAALAGPAARDKGMALFPRTVGGRHLALSRWDRENISLSTSDDGRVWERAGTLYAPRNSWELVQLGNCGSPIETEAGWLVLTHGVGPLRTYGIGVLLLDLDEPTRCLATLTRPLLTASADERDGYVPNVVYSCGALRHGDALTIPYGMSDSAIGFATVDVPTLLGELTVL